MTERITFVEDAVEDAIVSLVEQGTTLPQSLDVWYTEEEWVAVERLHRLKINPQRKLVLVADRYPFIRTQVLGVSVNLAPEPKYEHVETIH